MRRVVLLCVIVVVAGACVALGFWQLGRLKERRALNAEAAAARTLPLLVPDSGPTPGLLANRRARVSGVLDQAHEFVLRNRLVRGVPAVLIITPMRLPGSDTAVLINRGYVPAPDAMDPGSVDWSEPGPRTYTGVLLPIPDRGDGAPISRNGRETWKSLDLTAMRSRLPYPVVSLYLLTEADSSEGAAHTLDGRVYPFRAELPAITEGPHLSYGLQWFGIATAVVLFGVMFVLRRKPAAAPGGDPAEGDRLSADG
jgi:surfeit locus 1 family protein